MRKFTVGNSRPKSRELERLEQKVATAQTRLSRVTKRLDETRISLADRNFPNKTAKEQSAGQLWQPSSAHSAVPENADDGKDGSLGRPPSSFRSKEEETRDNLKRISSPNVSGKRVNPIRALTMAFEKQFDRVDREKADKATIDLELQELDARMQSAVEDAIGSAQQEQQEQQMELLQGLTADMSAVEARVLELAENMAEPKDRGLAQLRAQIENQLAARTGRLLLPPRSERRGV